MLQGAAEGTLRSRTVRSWVSPAPAPAIGLGRRRCLRRRAGQGGQRWLSQQYTFLTTRRPQRTAAALSRAGGAPAPKTRDTSPRVLPPPNGSAPRPFLNHCARAVRHVPPRLRPSPQLWGSTGAPPCVLSQFLLPPSQSCNRPLIGYLTTRSVRSVIGWWLRPIGGGLSDSNPGR